MQGYPAPFQQRPATIRARFSAYYILMNADTAPGAGTAALASLCLAINIHDFRHAMPATLAPKMRTTVAASY